MTDRRDEGPMEVLRNAASDALDLHLELSWEHIRGDPQVIAAMGDAVKGNREGENSAEEFSDMLVRVVQTDPDVRRAIALSYAAFLTRGTTSEE